MMNELERSEIACQIGLKGVHSLMHAQHYMKEVCLNLDGNHQRLVASLFLSAVIRYTRPFSDTKSRYGTLRLPLRDIKSEAGFSMEMHKHLLRVRDKLMAHDDIEEIEPRIVTVSLSIPATNISIPVRLGMASKALAYPADAETADKIFNHMQAAYAGSTRHMEIALGNYRKALIAAGLQAGFIQEKIGTQLITDEAVNVAIPGIPETEHLEPKHPDFSHVHSGYRYEYIRMQRDFTDPLEVKLSDGSTLFLGPDNQKPNQTG